MATINYNGMELEEFNPDKSVSFDPPIKCVGWNNKDVKIEFELSAALSKDIWLHRFIGKSKDDNPVAFMFCALFKEKPAPRRDAWIEYNKYPLHPGQTHAEPLYATIPLEEYERLMEENKRLKSQFGWRSWKLDPPKANGKDDFIFCGHQKYDHQPDEETEYFVDVGYLDMDGTLCMFNDWHEGQETFEIDYWFPLPMHPDEPKKETKEDK